MPVLRIPGFVHHSWPVQQLDAASLLPVCSEAVTQILILFFAPQVQAMELDTLTPDMPALLKEMGVAYDPQLLADRLASRWPQV